MAHLILYKDVNLLGERRDVYHDEPFLAGFNDVTSSFEIVDGNWEFFVDAGFQSKRGPGFLGRGKYSWVEAVGIPNDALSSVRQVVRQ